MAAAVALGAVGAAYGARTYQRNPDWQNDETLFASAAEAVPHSFRPHMSLAYSWYTQDPIFFQGERAIAQAETAAAIVSGLPDSRIPAATLTLLGVIYCARGDSLAPKDAGGNPQLDAASGAWYRKALAVDLRAVPVDRAFDENHRRRELARGTPADETAVTGLPDLYASLAPGTALAYLNIAAAGQALNQVAEAATALLEAYTLDGAQSTLRMLSETYGKIDSGGCAVLRQAEGRSLNPDCAILRRDLCGAYRDLEQAFRDAKQRDPAERFRAAGERVPGCR